MLFFEECNKNGKDCKGFHFTLKVLEIFVNFCNFLLGDHFEKAQSNSSRNISYYKKQGWVMAIQSEFQRPMLKAKSARNSSIKSRKRHPKFQRGKNSAFYLIKGHCMNPIVPQKTACSVMHSPKL